MLVGPILKILEILQVRNRSHSPERVSPLCPRPNMLASGAQRFKSSVLLLPHCMGTAKAHLPLARLPCSSSSWFGLSLLLVIPLCVLSVGSVSLNPGHSATPASPSSAAAPPAERCGHYPLHSSRTQDRPGRIMSGVSICRRYCNTREHGNQLTAVPGTSSVTEKHGLEAPSVSKNNCL